MQVRGNLRRRNADAGFALSDHADWNGLLQAVKALAHKSICYAWISICFQPLFK
jgi:putative mRNA 3-end processing factor